LKKGPRRQGNLVVINRKYAQGQAGDCHSKTESDSIMTRASGGEKGVEVKKPADDIIPSKKKHETKKTTKGMRDWSKT